MKHSIRKQFSVIFILIMLATVLMTIAMNILFLRNFHVQIKQRDIINAYLQINNLSKKHPLASKPFQDEMLDLCEKYSINIIIMDNNSQILASVSTLSKNVSSTPGSDICSSAIKTIFSSGVSLTDFFK